MLPDGADFATNLAAQQQRDMAIANPAPGPRPGEVAGEAAGLEAAKAVFLKQQAEQQAAAQQAPATAMDGGAPPELPYKVLGSAQVGGSPGGEVTTVGPTGLKILQGQNQAEDNYLQRQEAHSANIAGAEGDKVVALRGAAQRQQESYDRQAAMFAAKQGEADKLKVEVEKAGNELASTKIDPERYWSNKSVGSKIAIGIGAFLSGLGSGMQGRAGENKVLESLSKEIDRDVQSQIDAYNARAKNVDAKRSLYGQLIEKYGPEKAESVLADAHYKKAQLMVDAATASSNSEKALARGDELRMEIEQQRAARLMKTVQKVPASAGTMKRLVQLPDGSKVLMNDKEMTDYSVKQQELGLKRGEAGLKAQNETGKLAVDMPDGTTRLANRTDDASKATGRVAAYKRIDMAFEEAEKLRDGIGAALKSGKLAEANALRTQLVRLGLNTAKTIESAGEQGVLREGETANALNITTGFTSMQPGAGESLKMGRKLFQNDFEQTLKTFAPTEADVKIVDGKRVVTAKESAVTKAPAGPPPGATRRQ